MMRETQTRGPSLAQVLVTVGLILFAGVPAAARTVEYISQGVPLFRFELPDDWKFLQGTEVPAERMPAGQGPAPRVISVRPPGEDGVMWTGLWSPPGVRNLTEARAYLQRLRPNLLDGTRIGYRDERQVNGKPAQVISGTGNRQGRDFDFVFAIVQITTGRVAIAAFIGEAGIFDRNEAALIDVLNSLQLVEAAR